MIRASVAGSRLEVASSSTSRPGAASISAARLARFISPPESVAIGSCRTLPRPTSAITRSIAACRSATVAYDGSLTAEA